MQDRAFDDYMRSRNLADKTRTQRAYALKRIERAQGVDLDSEFERDQLAGLLKQFEYTAADARVKRPNPSKLDIDIDKLPTQMPWYRSHLVDYIRFKGGQPRGVDGDTATGGEPSAILDELIEEAVGRTFALEKDLQSALRANLGDLEAGLVVEDGGNERKVEAGFIDILARDKAGILTVIELKAEVSRPDAVTQILAYMGCIAAETGESVRGILVASDHHPRVAHAARAIPNLTLKKYRFKYEFD